MFPLVIRYSYWFQIAYSFQIILHLDTATFIFKLYNYAHLPRITKISLIAWD